MVEMKDYNILYNGDTDGYIGFYRDMVRYLKDLVCEDIKKSNDYNNDKEILDLLDWLEKEYDRGILGDLDLIEVAYQPMGAYCYCKWEREKEE